MKCCRLKICSMFTFICVFIICAASFAQAEEREIIRVGYFDYRALFDKNTKGIYTGYSKEYLTEIAKYTGWEYEYIPGNLVESFVWLNNDEIDLLCAAQYSEERAKIYAYSKYPIGTEFATMYVLPQNDAVYYEDFKAFNGLKVGMVSGSYQNILFDAYMQEHDFQVEKYYYSSYEELKRALHKREIDAFLCGSLDGETKEKVVAQFAPMPYYFITAKKNAAMMDKLNSALERIRVENPYLEMKLYEKYYGEAVSRLKLRREEIRLIEESRPLKIVCSMDVRPLEFFDEGSGSFAGAYVDMVKLMLKRSNIKYEFIGTHTVEEGLDKVRNGEADLLLSTYANDELEKEYDIAFTAPYVYEKNVIVGKKGMIFDDAAILTVAMLRENIDFSYLLAERYPFWTVKYYDTLEECMDAVHRGDTDITLQNADLVMEFFWKNNHDDLVTISALNTEIPISLAISKHLPPEMINILHKTIFAVSKKDINDIMIKNTLSKTEKMSLVDFLRQKRVELTIVLMISAMLIFLALRYIRQSKAAELAHATYTDRLTGLRNFEKFEMDAKSIISAEPSINYAILYMDIEKFKYINEVFGYKRGNAVLVYLAKLFVYQLESGELFARVSGDQFVALLKYGEKEALSDRLKKFYNIVASMRSTLLDNNTLAIMGGIYCLTGNEENIAVAIDRANLARKSAKGMHYSNYVFYDHGLHSQAMKEKEIENIMEQALANEEFIIYLQPQYELTTRKVVGAEALVRWRKSSGEIISPNAFIPVFERNGFIKEFDFYVFRQVCKLQCKWRGEGDIDLSLAVNFSRLHINDAHFVEKVKQILKETGADPRRMEVEMTESAFAERDEHSSTLIADLQQLGFSVAMDDFGTGYSSLNLLKEVDFNVLKLDKSFLINEPISKKEKILISNIIRMAKELDISVIAEGIETEEQETLLRELSCDIGQGYYFARPMPVEELERMLKNK